MAREAFGASDMKIILGILCLFFLVLFHEIGHFFVAKLFGVKVMSFSIGFGPILLHKTYNETDYRLSFIPLGGYCGMKGENDFQYAIENKLDHIDADSDSLYGVHPLKRALIAFAGPFFNLFFTFFSFFLIAVIGYTYYAYSSKVIMADELYSDMHSVAKDAGLMSGDVIVKINNIAIENFSDVVTEVSSRPDENIMVTVDRNGEILNFQVKTELDKKSGIGKIGVSADTTTASQYEVKGKSFFKAIIQGLKETVASVRITIVGIFTLFKGVDITQAVSGPARIVDMIGDVVVKSFSESLRSGVINALSFLAYISISLFIMNLLPIPILDGSLILFALLEFVTKRKMHPKVLYYIQFVGLFFIVALFMIGLTGDIKYFLKK